MRLQVAPLLHSSWRPIVKDQRIFGMGLRTTLTRAGVMKVGQDSTELQAELRFQIGNGWERF